MCSTENEATKPITHDMFERGDANVVQNGPQQLESLSLKANEVSACIEDSLCDEDQDTYPEKAINFLLYR